MNGASDSKSKGRIVQRHRHLRAIRPSTSDEDDAHATHGRVGFGNMIDTAKLDLLDEAIEGKPCYIIHPEGRIIGIWDSITAMALIFTALVTPFEVGFLPSPETPLDGLFVVNRLLDAIFIIDMVLSSLMMYRAPQRKQARVKHAARRSVSTANLRADAEQESREVRPWEFRLKFVCLHYLTGSWFLIDVLSVAPSAFDILPFASPSASLTEDATNNATALGEWGSGDTLLNATGAGGADDDQLLTSVKVLRVIRTLRLMKLLRLVRGSRMLKRWETRISMPYSLISLSQIMLMVLC